MAEALRAGAFQTLDHFMRETADGAKIEVQGNAQGIVLIQAIKRGALGVYVAAIEQIGQRRFKIG